MHLSQPPYRLIVGLGNPGAEYERTRHNVGFMLLDRIVRGRTMWRRERAWSSVVAKVDGAILCKPQTFMNLSGGAVHSISTFFRIPPKEVLVVLDDMSLPLGRLRLRAGGSSGGQKGLKNIIEILATQDVARLRMGIGGAAPSSAVEHVLGEFKKHEMNALDEMLERAESVIQFLQTGGIEAAMSAFN